VIREKKWGCGLNEGDELRHTAFTRSRVFQKVGDDVKERRGIPSKLGGSRVHFYPKLHTVPRNLVIVRATDEPGQVLALSRCGHSVVHEWPAAKLCEVF
jgi:hypothetical protein